MSLDNWDDLKFVLSMMRHGTMSAAARFLDTNVATVSRRIERVSQELGVPLFEKRGQAFVATESAKRLAEIGEEIEQKLRGAMATMKAGDRNTPVGIEIAAPPAVHHHYVLPRTRTMAHDLPNVRLTLTDKVYSQGLGEADIQVRIGRPEGGRLKARKFRDYNLSVYHGRDHVLDGQWIGLSQRYPDADLVREIYKDANASPTYRVDEMPMMLDMIQATGLPGVLPGFMAEETDEIVLADLPDNAISGELWIAYHETRHGDATLRSVVEWFCGA
ncbi:LysR family transcriptional regulator [Jannaschia sp. KMU-145]|uniref:LysR family transcriptional regulator n=1 Tax=Jannaschia halovivens TaxID=3388667 RepID=UPI00396B0203